MRKNNSTIKFLLFLSLFLAFSIVAGAQKTSLVAERNIRAEMNFLAGDAMQGRGSGTIFERIAAEYVGSQFMQFGLEPAGEKDAAGNPTFVQTVNVQGRSYLQELKISGELGNSVTLGKELAIFFSGDERHQRRIAKIEIGRKSEKRRGRAAECFRRCHF